MKKIKNLLSIIGVCIGVLIFNMIVNDFMLASGTGTGLALITAGFTKTCTARSGGCKNVWLANRADIAAAGFTLSAGEYTAVTMESGKVFYKFSFDEDTAEHRWNAKVENKSTSVTNEIEFYLGKMSTLMRNSMQEVLDISPCGIVAIVEDNNSVKWVYGYTENHPATSASDGRPLAATEIAAASGKVFTDQNGTNVILQAINNQAPLVFTGSVPV